MGEVWREVAGYDGKYEVSSLGRVRSNWKYHGGGRQVIRIDRQQAMKGNLKATGYLTVHLSFPGERPRSPRIHRLVAQAFIPNPSNLPEVNHKNGIKTDNRVENLEWVTAKQNHQHACDLGLCKTPPFPIRCVTTGVIYESVLSAARALGLQNGNIWTQLKGKRAHASGYIFEPLQKDRNPSRVPVVKSKVILRKSRPPSPEAATIKK